MLQVMKVVQGEKGFKLGGGGGGGSPPFERGMRRATPSLLPHCCDDDMNSGEGVWVCNNSARAFCFPSRFIPHETVQSRAPMVIESEK